MLEAMKSTQACRLFLMLVPIECEGFECVMVIEKNFFCFFKIK